jgi:hypothetical protein
VGINKKITSTQGREVLIRLTSKQGLKHNVSAKTNEDNTKSKQREKSELTGIEENAKVLDNRLHTSLAFINGSKEEANDKKFSKDKEKRKTIKR